MAVDQIIVQSHPAFFTVATIILTCWEIWTDRNYFIFKGVQPNISTAKAMFAKEMKILSVRARTRFSHTFDYGCRICCNCSFFPYLFSFISLFLCFSVLSLLLVPSVCLMNRLCRAFLLLQFLPKKKIGSKCLWFRICRVGRNS